MIVQHASHLLVRLIVGISSYPLPDAPALHLYCRKKQQNMHIW
ncbi:hypothetical protein HMPREF0880_03484 [Yokenella regensburgei ATCC 43003]|nr:hypothetical protein HMPREF0880_03484 [Yokenella regensburgei ATCC 43003]